MLLMSVNGVDDVMMQMMMLVMKIDDVVVDGEMV